MKIKKTTGLPVTAGRNRAGLWARLCSFAVLAAILAGFTAAVVYTGQEPVGDNSSQAFFVANDQVTAECRNVYAVFSTVILGENSGAVNVYAFFSNIEIMEGAVVTGKIKTLSSTVLLPNDSGNWEISPYLYGLFESWLDTDGGTLFSNEIPSNVLNLMFTLLGAVVYLASFIMFRGFLEQGAMAMTAEPVKIIRNGVVTYLLTAIFILLFSLSVILLPIAAVLAVIFLAAMAVGQAALSMLIGLTISRRLRKRLPALVCLALGWLPLAIITNIPIINFGVVYIFLPILSAGITVTALINGFLKKVFYYAPFGTTPPPLRADNRRIREIITGKDSENVI